MEHIKRVNEFFDKLKKPNIKITKIIIQEKTKSTKKNEI